LIEQTTPNVNDRRIAGRQEHQSSRRREPLKGKKGERDLRAKGERGKKKQRGSKAKRPKSDEKGVRRVPISLERSGSIPRGGKERNSPKETTCLPPAGIHGGEGGNSRSVKNTEVRFLGGLQGRKGKKGRWPRGISLRKEIMGAMRHENKKAQSPYSCGEKRSSKDRGKRKKKKKSTGRKRGPLAKGKKACSGGDQAVEGRTAPLLGRECNFTR